MSTALRRFITGCVVLVGVAACSPAERSAESTTTTLAATTTTTAATTTTFAPTTTTTSVPATTTTTEATTTTLAPATTTTEAPEETVTLTDEGVFAGSTWLYFGYDDDDVIAAVADVIGPPSEDSGWLDSATEGWERFGVCPSPRVRGVNWGEGSDVSLQLLFTDGDTDFWSGGVEHFYSYYYFGTSTPSSLTTPEGVGIGSTIGDLRSIYSPSSVTVEEAFFDPSEGFWTYEMRTWTGLWGYATGTADSDSITSINAGQGCGE